MQCNPRARRAAGATLVLVLLAGWALVPAAAGPRAPAALVDLPRPKPSETVLASVSSRKGEKPATRPAKARDCLAKAIYFEARGEAPKGQVAVGRVILNRVKDERYPGTVCEVVFQNAEKRNRCQFSFACDGKTKNIADKKVWREILRRADWLLACRVECGETPVWRDALWRSTHYHADYVSPGWAKRMRPTGQVGLHRFFYEARL
nr:cell wall hydrolase [Afifella pfennigii]